MNKKAAALITLLAVLGVGLTVAVVVRAFGAPADGGPAPTSEAAPSGDLAAASPSVEAGATASASPADVTAPTPTATTPPADPMSGQSVVTEAPVVVVTAQSVPVRVTFYGWDATRQVAQVGGYVTGVIETGGTCTLTLTNGSRTVTASVPARADATTTACGAVTVPGAQLDSGTWQAVLSYRSSDHSGAASPVAIEVAG